MAKKRMRAAIAVLILLLFLLLPFAAIISSAGEHIPPYLQILEPEEGAVLLSDFEIAHVSSDEDPYGVDLYLDGLLIAEGIPDRHQLTGVSEGERNITLRAENSHGLISFSSVNVIVDVSDPLLSFIHPAAGAALTEDSVLLQWSMQEDNPHQLLLFLDDGDGIDVSAQEELLCEGLSDGEHRARLWAEDMAGNSAELTLDFSVNTGRPLLKFLSPEKNSLHSGNQLRVDWEVQPSVASIEYRLDKGSWMPGASSGVNLVDLSPGRHLITLRATLGEKVSEASLPFQIEDTLPRLKIASPLPNMVFSGGSALLAWDAIGISGHTSEVSLDGGAWETVDGNSVLLQGLSAGNHVVKVRVSGGNAPALEETVQFSSCSPGALLGPVVINSDAGLRNLVNIYNLPGDGTAADPYRISGMGIDAGGSPYGFMVRDTTHFLEIQDCVVYNTSASSKGFSLQNVRDLSIQGCVAREQEHGIRLLSLSKRLSIIDNDLSRAQVGGISIDQADNAVIEGNDCSNAGRWGILAGWNVSESRDMLINDNDCREHGLYGISLRKLEVAHIEGNNARDGRLEGSTGVALLSTTSRINVINNDCRDNGFGVLAASFSTGNVISSNDCRSDLRRDSVGVLLSEEVSDNLVLDNDCRMNSVGVLLNEGANDNQVEGNDCSDNPEGITLHSASRNRIVQNDCSQTVPSQDSLGISISDAHFSILVENNCLGNRLGIHSIHSESLQIRGNNCSQAHEEGILVEDLFSNYEVEGNDCSQAGGGGIRALIPERSVSNARIEGNNCSNSGAMGIELLIHGVFESSQLIENNCTGSGLDLIHVSAHAHTSITFLSNNVSAAPLMPIRLISASGTYNDINISKNDMSDASENGLELSGNLTWIWIHENDISGSAENAIILESDNAIEYLEIVGNLLHSPTLDAVSISAPRLHEGKIDENVCPGHHSGPLQIDVPRLVNLSISQNEFPNCGGGLILTERFFENLRVVGNDFSGSQGTLIHLQSIGSTSGMRVNENLLQRNGGVGILVQIAQTISSSEFSGNRLDGIRDMPLSIICDELLGVQISANVSPYSVDNPLSLQARKIEQVAMFGNQLGGSSGYGLNVEAEELNFLSVVGNQLGGASLDSLRISSPQAMEGIDVISNQLGANGGHGLLLLSSQSLQHVTVYGNAASGSALYPLRLQSPSIANLLVEDNDIKNAPSRPLWLQSPYLQDIQIVGNDASNAGAQGLGINAPHIRDLSIIDNIFDDAQDDGVEIVTSGPLLNLLISNNMIQSVGGDAIVLECASLGNSTISYNTCPDSNHTPLLVRTEAIDGFSVLYNDFRRSGGHGVDLSTPLLRNLNITGNHVEDASGDGIRVQMLGPGILEDVLVFANTASRASGDGVYLRGPSLGNIIVLSNTLDQCAEDGVSLHAYAGQSSITATTLQLNNVMGSGVHGMRLQADLLYQLVLDMNNARSSTQPLRMDCARAEELRIISNDLSYGGSYGVRLVADIEDLRVEGNVMDQIEGDAVSLISVLPIRDVVIISNHIVTPSGGGVYVNGAGLSQLDISSNYISNSDGDGIELLSSQSAGHMRIANNQLITQGAEGFRLNAASLVEVELIGNHIRSPDGRPIWITASTSRSLQIVGNDASYSPLTPILLDVPALQSTLMEDNILLASGQDGIRLNVESIDGMQILTNDLGATPGYGFIITADSITALEIHGNTLQSAGRDALHIQADGLNGLSIRQNEFGEATDHGLLLLADLGRNLSASGNTLLTAGADAMRVQIDDMRDLSIAQNQFGEAADHGLLLLADVARNLSASGNALTSAGYDALRVEVGDLRDLSVLQNDLGDAGDYGMIVRSNSIRGLTLQGNSIDSAGNDGISLLSLGILNDLNVIGNELGDLAGMAMHLDHRGSLLRGNISDNSAGTSPSYGLLVDSHESVSQLLISGNEFAAAGDDGIRLNLPHGASSLTVEGNEVPVCAGDLVHIFSEGILRQTSILANSGPGDIIGLAPRWQSGSVDGNVIEGSLLLTLPEHLSLDSVSENLLDGGHLALRASALSIGDMNENIAQSLTLEAELAALSVDRSNDNVIALDWLWTSPTAISSEEINRNHMRSLLIEADVQMRLGSIISNRIGPCDPSALQLLSPSIHAESISGNTVASVLDAISIIADDEIVLGWIDGNQLQSDDVVIRLQSPLVITDSISVNRLVQGSPRHFLLIESESVELGFLNTNTMNVDSSQESVLIRDFESIEIGGIADNVLRGDVILGAVTIDVGNVSSNQIGGDLLLSALTDLEMGHVRNNQMGLWAAAGEEVSVASARDNILSSDLLLHADTILNIGVVDGNSMEAISLEAEEIGLERLSDNGALQVLIQADTIKSGPIRDNILRGDLRLLAAESINLDHLSRNGASGLLEIYAPSVSCGEVRSNVFTEEIDITAGDTLLCGDVLYNNAKSLYLSSPISTLADVSGNILDSNLLISSPFFTAGDIDGNSGHRLMLSGQEASMGSVSDNTLSRIFLVEIPELVAGDICRNTADSFTISSEATMFDPVSANLGNLSGNIVVKDMVIEAPSLQTGNIDDNEANKLTLRADDAEIGSISRNTLAGEMLVQAPMLRSGSVSGNAAETITVRADDAILGNVSSNSLSGLLLLESPLLRCDDVDDNELEMLSILTDDLVAGSISRNTLLNGGLMLDVPLLRSGNIDGNEALFLIIESDDAVTGSISRNVLDAGLLLEVPLLRSGSIDGNTAELLSIHSDDAVTGSISFNSLIGGLLVEVPLLRSGDIDGNIAGSLTIVADDAFIGSVSYNGFSGGLSIEAPLLRSEDIVGNMAGPLTISADDAVIGNVSHNTLSAGLLVEAPLLLSGDMDWNDVELLSVVADDAVIGDVSHNVIDEGIVIEVPQLQAGNVEANTAKTLSVIADSADMGGICQNILSSNLRIEVAELSCLAISYNRAAELRIISDSAQMEYVGSNLLQGDLILTVDGPLSTHDISDNGASSLLVSSDEATVGNISGNILSGDLLFEIPILQCADVADNQADYLIMRADKARLGNISGNAVSNDLLLVIPDLQCADVVDNQLGFLAIRADEATIGTVYENVVAQEIQLDAPLLQCTEISGNEADMLYVDAETLTMGDLSTNVVQNGMIIRVAELQIGNVSSNEGGTLFISGESLRMGEISFNQFSSGMMMSSTGSLESGEIVGNTALMFVLSAETVEIGDLLSNSFSDRLQIVADRIVMGRMSQSSGGDFILDSTESILAYDIDYNHLSGGISIEASELLTGQITNNHAQGSLLLNAPDMTIQGDIVDNHFSTGIAILSQDLSVSVISRNSMDACSGDGIVLESSGSLTLEMFGNSAVSQSGNGAGIRVTADEITLDASQSSMEDFSDGAIVLIATSISLEMSNADLIDCGHGILTSSAEATLVLREVDIEVNAGGDGIYVDAQEATISLVEVNIAGGLRGLHAPGLVSLDVRDLLFQGCGTGMELDGGSLNITNSFFMSCHNALKVSNADEVRIMAGTFIYSTGNAVELLQCGSVDIRNSNFFHNVGYALMAEGCDELLVIWNEFTYNNNSDGSYDPSRPQCYDDSVESSWSKPRYHETDGMEGNLWSDWLTPDDDLDGIVDFPYLLAGGAVDHWPLTTRVDEMPPWLVIHSPDIDSLHAFTPFELRWEAVDNRSGLGHNPLRIYQNEALLLETFDYEGSMLIPVISLSEGYHNLRVEVSDNAHNLASVERNFLVDRGAPEIHWFLPMNDSVHRDSLELSWLVSDEYDPSPRCDIRVDGGDWAEGLNSPYILGSLTEGWHTLELRVLDHLGHSSTDSRRILVDLTPPVIDIITPLDNALLGSRDVEMLWTTADLSQVNCWVAVDASQWRSVEADRSFIFQNLPDGPHTLRVRAMDQAGWVSEESIEIFIDTTPPQISILSPSSSSISSSSDVSMTWSVQDASSWTAELRAGGSWIPVGDALYHTFSGLSDGWNDLEIRVTDAAGNQASAMVGLVVDTTPPLLEIVSPAEGSFLDDRIVFISWELSDITSCVQVIQLEGWAPQTHSGSSQGYYLADGEYTFHIEATDAAGWSTQRMVNFTVDSTVPQISILSPSSNQILDSVELDMSWVVNDLTACTAEVSSDSISWTFVGDSLYHRFTNLQEGGNELFLRVTDSAGNEAMTSVSVFVDTQPPELSIVSPSPSEIFDLSKVRLEWQLSDSTPCVVQVWADDGSPLTVLGSSYLFTLTDGSHVLNVRATDAAGWVTERQVSVIVDVTKPVITDLYPVKQQILDSSSVTMTWAVNEMHDWTAEISHNEGDWFEIGMVLSHEFTGMPEWLNSFQLRITDIAGNTAEVLTWVFVDTEAPVLEILSPQGGDSFNHKEIELTWSLSDITPCVVEVWANDAPPVTVTGTTYLFTLPEGVSTLNVRATDLAGWVSHETVSVLVDTIPPTLSILSPADGDVILTSNSWLSWDSDGLRVELSLDGGDFQVVSDDVELSFQESGSHVIVLRAYDEVENMASATVSFDVVLTRVTQRSPEGEGVAVGPTEVSIMLDKGPDQLEVRVNGDLVPYQLDGRQVTIELDLDYGRSYAISVSGVGVDGSEIVGGSWEFQTEGDPMQTALLVTALVAPTGLGAAYVLRPRLRRP